jgi:hypothetical protein
MTFKIFFQINDQAPVLAFTWTKISAQAGIARAKKDAVLFGYDPSEMTFFAQSVATGEIVAYG